MATLLSRIFRRKVSQPEPTDGSMVPNPELSLLKETPEDVAPSVSETAGQAVTAGSK